MAPSGNSGLVCLPIFETRRRLLSKKELPEGIYNYETTGSGIQIIIELISGLFDSVHNLSVCGYSYQSDDV